MNIRALLLAASILANAILLAAVANRSLHWTDRFSSGERSPNRAAGTPAGTPGPIAPAIDPQTWTTLSTGNFAAVATQLKAEGFPPYLQRAILSALIAEQQFGDRHRAIAAMIDGEPWWGPSIYMSKTGSKIVAARQQLSRDEKEALDQLLGADSGMTDYKRAQNQRQFGDLPPDKLSELARIEADYAELAREVKNSGFNIMLPEDREKLALLEREKRADIAKLLTPDELLDYDLRSSPSAGQLRSQLSAFNPTEDEFRELFRLQQAFDTKYGGGNLDTLTPEQRRARALAQSELLKDAQRVLSPERYTELKEKADPVYISSNAFVTRMQLPASATAEIVAVQKDVQKRAMEIRNDANLSAAERSVRLSALADEASLRLSPTVGGMDGLNAYKQSSGAWLNYLKPAPTPPASASNPNR